MMDVPLKQLVHPLRLVIAAGVSGAWDAFWIDVKLTTTMKMKTTMNCLAGGSSKFGNELARTPS